MATAKKTPAKTVTEKTPDTETQTESEQVTEVENSDPPPEATLGGDELRQYRAQYPG